MSYFRLKIAFIGYKFGHQYGGAEAYGVELMRELATRHDITVIAREYDPNCDLQLPFIPIILSDRWPSWIRSYLFAKATDRLVKNGNYDLIHSHMNGWNGDVDVLHVKSVRYHWVTKTTSWLKKITNALSPRIQMYLWLEKKRVHLRPPRRTIVVSESLKKQLQLAYDTKYPFDIVPPGVHLPQIDPTIRDQMRNQLGYDANDIVCIQVARNPMNKGLASILTALKTLPSQIKLLVVGSPPSLEKKLARILNHQDLISRVTFVGQTPLISPYYQAADLALHPTFNDSFGMAPLEAMSYGLPVIMSNEKWCGFSYYANDNENALLLSDPNDATELKKAILRIIDEPLLGEKLSSNGQQLAAQFSWKLLAKQVEAIYVDIIATRLHQGRPDPKA